MIVPNILFVLRDSRNSSDYLKEVLMNNKQKFIKSNWNNGLNVSANKLPADLLLRNGVHKTTLSSTPTGNICSNINTLILLYPKTTRLFLFLWANCYSPYGQYRKHFHWSAIKRYFANLLFLILLLALLYISALLHR